MAVLSVDAPTRRPYVHALRLAAGTLVGAGSWFALRPLLLDVPLPLRFFLAWFLFTFGPGAGLGAALTRGLEPVSRVIVLLGFGSAATAVVIDLLGRVDLLHVFPFVALGLAGAGLANWRGPARAQGAAAPPFSWAVVAASLVIVAITLSTSAVVFSHRVVTTDGVALHGDYDSFDLSYYAAIASEATHTVPPTASFYAGHALNAAYYPQLVVAMVRRFAGVPLLASYFGYAWPAFLGLGALTLFVLTRALASTSTALLAAVLTLLCGDFSYLAAWFLPNTSGSWDYLLWPTNFLSPTMEVLHFNTWTPSLPLFFTALYAIVRGLQTGERGWTAASAILLAVLFQFKPFAWAVTLGALFCAAAFSFGDAAARRRLAATLVLAAGLSLPFLYGVTQLGGDQRSRLVFATLLLPQRMLLKLDLIGTVGDFVARVVPIDALRRPAYLLAATLLFFAGGLGVRWAGLGGVWHAISSRARTLTDGSSWRVLAWIVVVGVFLPCAVATEPYQDTLQFYQTGLYVLWIFTALAFTSMARARPRAGRVAIALAILITLPSSLHYLSMKWTDGDRPPLTAIGRNEVGIANYLRTYDPETTVILDDRPRAASLLTILSERRTVLSWGHPNYAPGSGSRADDVDAFYGSAGGDPAAAMATLHRYQVTHVIVHHDRDHVHPDVIAKLQPLLRAADVTLYAAPRSAEP